MPLRNFLAIVSVMLSLTACKQPPVNRDTARPLSTVASVDLDRYLGRWYEIARLPNSFEEGCVAVTATYDRNNDGSVRVTNRCRVGGFSGETQVAEGTARIVDPSTNAKLAVTFFWPFEGDYWIIGLADDYSWALVGEPSGRYLWILARNAHISSDLKSDLISKLEKLGYVTDALYWTPHP